MRFTTRVVVITIAVLVAACGGGGGTGAGDPPDAEGAAASADGQLAAASNGVRGQAPPASGGIPAMVTLRLTETSGSASAAGAAPDGSRPSSSHPAAPARGDEALVDQFGLAFSPRVLVAAEGEPVRFTNSEGAITHNVHLRSVGGDSTVFNGDTGPSEGIEVLLPGSGGYDVLCDMHPGMTGFVFVTDAPYAVAADSDGSFDLGRIPPGEYVARVWTVDDGWKGERAVTITTDPTPLDLAGR